MKRICITYHMSKNLGTFCNPVTESAENCITTSMTDDVVDDLITNQRNSRMAGGGFGLTALSIMLDSLAELQGYSQASFVCAELA